jgi:hypothetical protein
MHKKNKDLEGKTPQQNKQNNTDQFIRRIYLQNTMLKKMIAEIDVPVAEDEVPNMDDNITKDDIMNHLTFEAEETGENGIK